MDNMTSEVLSLHPNPMITRRGFIVATVGTGFAVSMLPVAAQTIQTDSQGLDTATINIPVKDGNLPAYMARPIGKKDLPVVLVVQEIFGVHEYIQDVCRRLAKEGYFAIAPELYARQGDPQQYTNVSELLNQIVSKVPDAQVMHDLDACVLYAKQQGANVSRLGITGFCWGGRITWLYAAHNKNVKAAVAWYGRLVGQTSALTPKNPIDIAQELTVPVLGLYGRQDQGIPVTTISQMQHALKHAQGHGTDSRFILYPDASHAFHADYRPSYRPQAAQDGWAQLLKWFKNRI